MLAQCTSLREHLVAGVTFVSNMKMRFFHMPRKALLIYPHTIVMIHPTGSTVVYA